MKINVMPVGMLGTNCFIIESDKKNAMIIDAGANAEGILDFCKKQDLTVKMLVFTHGHFDHTGAMTQLVEKTGAKTYIHELDEDMMISPESTQSDFFFDFDGYVGKNADVCYHDGDVISLDDISLRVMHTPGHTKGSCILIGDGVIFTGDTIFAGSAGRTDLYGGNHTQLLSSLKKIAKLKGEYTMLTGHGKSTTLSYEKTTNPYMGTNYDDIF